VLHNVRLEFTPGTTYQYSNFGYCVLGRIIESVTGTTYETAMRDDLFAPSGATSFTLAQESRGQRLPDEVAYHTRVPRAPLTRCQSRVWTPTEGGSPHPSISSE
jgi:CubicO group peptidase (beta-lactamase class C family)